MDTNVHPTLWLLIGLLAFFVTALSMRARQWRERPIKNCREGRSCPYTVIYRYRPGAGLGGRVDSETMFRCCRFRRDLEAVDELCKRQQKAARAGGAREPECYCPAAANTSPAKPAPAYPVARSAAGIGVAVPVTRSGWR